MRFGPHEIRVEAISLAFLDRDEALKQLKQHLLRVQQQMKSQADKHRREVKFSVGDWVYLKLKPHRQQSVTRRVYPKLSARFFGPYQIIAQIDSVAYRLQLPDSSKIHLVFHVSLLKKAIGVRPSSSELPPELELDSSSEVYPDRVLSTRIVQKHGESVSQWLIQWHSKSIEEATWEDEFVIKA